MAKLKNIQKVAQGLGGTIGSFSDGSLSWVLIENDEHTINICFDGKGDKFEKITVAKKIYEVVSEDVIVEMYLKKIN